MQSRDFCFWLQGYFEILNASSNRPPEGLTDGQIETIKKHLNMVFIHEIDPSMGNPQKQQALNQAHGNQFGGGLPSGLVARC